MDKLYWKVKINGKWTFRKAKIISYDLNTTCVKNLVADSD